MFGSMGQSVIKNLGNGGEMDGDVTITGDLTVGGGISLSVDEVIQGTSTIDVDSTTALVVRKNGASGDVLIVDTDNSRVGINKTPTNSLHLDIGNGTPEFGKGITIETGDGSYTANRGGMLEFHNEDVIIAGIRAERPALGGFRGDLQFFTHSSASGNTYGTTFLERMRITNEGNVGIGTASPDYKLKVEESTNGADCSIAIRALNDGGAGRTAVLKVDPDAQTFTLGTPNIVTDISNERLGIGTTSPSGILSIFRDDSSTVGTNDVVIENDGSGDASLKFSLTGATDWYAYVDNSDSDKFKIRRSTTDHLSIDESGNATFAGSVGVGASPVSSFPAQNVTIEGVTAGLVLRDSTGSNQATQFFTLYSSNGDIIGMFDDSKSLKFGHADDAVGTNYTDVLTLGSDNSATFAGDVKLSSSTSSSPFLTIEDTNADDNMGGLKFIKDSASPNTGDKLMQIWAYGDNDYAEQILYSEIATLPTSVADGSEEGSMRFRVMNAGSFVETMRIRGNKVGIGTSSPDNELHITDGSAGSVTANSNSQVTIESNSHASLQFLSPNNANSIIYFGDVDDNDVGYINYAHSSNTMNFQTNAVVRLSIDGSGNSTFAGDVMINSSSANYADLTVGGTGDIVALRASSGTAGFTMYEGGTGRFNMTTLNGSGGIAFKTPSTTRMIIDDNSRISLSNNDGGTGNTIFGKSASPSQAGSNNTIIGENSALAMDGGEAHNIVIGSSAMRGADEGASGTIDFNVVIGNSALWGASFTGSEQLYGNIAIGYQSLNKDGDTNSSTGQVAIGHQALKALTSGIRNLAVGYNAGTGITTGTDNTLVGWGAGDGLTGAGTSNTLIGAEAEASSAGGTNQIAIGAAAVGQGSNTVVLGKASVSAIYCARNASASVEASAFNVGSDRKLKKNIRDTALQGINLIDQMQVRDFEWKDNNATVNGGLIAQELEAIYPDAVGKRNDDGDDGDVTMTISRESIVPLLIKAVQELSAKVKELESK